MTKYLTIAELAERSELPNSTCRRYLSTFEAFFLVKGGSRLKRYEQQAVDILKRIKGLYDDGLESNEIHNVLVGEFPLVIDGDEQQESEKTPMVPTLATSEDIQQIKKALDEQREFNQLLLEQLKQQQEYIDRKLEARDQRLIESIRAMQEVKQAQIEAAAVKQKKLGFWDRFRRR